MDPGGVMAGASARGIRSYGPGKFYTLLDSYAYELALDEGVDEEASYGEGEDWYGLVWLDNDARDQIADIAVTHDGNQLSGEELDLLNDRMAVIFFERSDGTIEADWFENKKEAEEAWAEIEADTSEEEEEGEEEEEEDDEVGYVILCRHSSGSSEWEREPDTDEYATIEDAEEVIATLETEDEDGASLEYKVVRA
jgi:hypothetical protein